MFPQRWNHADAQDNKPIPADDFFDDGQAVIATHSGYLQTIDKDVLIKLASENNFVIRLRKHPGDFVIAGAELVRLKCADQRCDEIFKKKIVSSFYLGAQRTPEQDPGFAIRQMAEIAVRALSSSFNDPFTAMICIDQLSAILCQLAQRKFPSAGSCDDRGQIRLVETPITFPDLLNDAFDLIRQYGRTSTSVTIRLLKVLRVIGERTTSSAQRDAILQQATMIEHASYGAITEANDRREAEQHFEAVLQALAQAQAQAAQSQKSR